MTRFTLLRRTRQEAATLVTAREDSDLQLNDALALKLQMLTCKACSQFDNQMLTMRAAMGKGCVCGAENDTTAYEKH